MKCVRATLCLVLIALSTMAFAQSDGEKSFDRLKTLAGGWEGPVTVTPAMPEMSTDKPIHISLRVTSRGNALVHEMQEKGATEDPTKYDHPVTVLYLDGGHLMLTHYCDAGNRPRMTARTSADGKAVDFDFVDVSGNLDHGHMQHATFTVIDANHHTEDWIYLMPGDKPIHAHMELTRTK